MRFLPFVAFLLLLCGAAMAQTQPTTSERPSGDGVDALIQILENDDTRAALIERLKADAGTTDADAAAEALVEAPDLSIARRLAEYTKAVAEGTSATLRSLATIFNDLRQGLSGTLHADFSALGSLIRDLILVGAGLFGSFLVLRLLVLRIHERLAARIAGSHWSTRLATAFASVVLDVVSVLLAWGLGYVIALALVGNERGQMGINQSLLLNAFLIVELAKLVVRALTAPRQQPLRILPMSDSNAAYWNFWIARIISLLGYTFLFVSPMLASLVSQSAAAAVQVLVMATAVTIGIIIVLQNRDDIRDWLNAIAERRQGAGISQIFIFIGRIWHILAILYLLTLLVVWFTNPDQALPFMLGATVQSIIVILVGTVVVSFISRFVSTGLQLPDDVKQRLPLLQARLHAFVPRVMHVVQWVVIIAVAAAIIQAWQVFDVIDWATSEIGLTTLGAVISAALIVIVCIVLHVVIASWVEYRLNPNFGRAPTAREKTLLNLFKNAFTVALVVFGLMLALAQIGVNIAPLLAGAGVVGLAIGFGAQKLVQDIITGIFIQFENVMNEGDVVAVGDKSGVVEKLTIRSVTIRDMTGTVHLIPFSSVDQVSNMVRGFSFHVAEIGVAYDSDIDEVKQALRDAFSQLMETDFRADIIDDLDMQGLIAFEASSITIRARIKTLPGKHWAVGRKYNELIKTIFAERNIEIPYPHITYVQGGEARASGRMLRSQDDGENGSAVPTKA